MGMIDKARCELGSLKVTVLLGTCLPKEQGGCVETRVVGS